MKLLSMSNDDDKKWINNNIPQNLWQYFLPMSYSKVNHVSKRDQVTTSTDDDQFLWRDMAWSDDIQ